MSISGFLFDFYEIEPFTKSTSKLYSYIRSLLILLFFWTNAIDRAVAATCLSDCRTNELCAEGLIHGKTQYECVAAVKCVGQSQGKCPSHQLCKAADGSNFQGAFACETVTCNKLRNGSCSAGRVCFSAPPDFYCKLVTCTPKKACKSPLQCTARGFCAWGSCGDLYGTCPGGQYCNSQDAGKAQPYACEGTARCAGNLKGPCNKDEVCAQGGTKGSKSYSCKSKKQ